MPLRFAQSRVSESCENSGGTEEMLAKWDGGRAAAAAAGEGSGVTAAPSGGSTTVSVIFSFVCGATSQMAERPEAPR